MVSRPATERGSVLMLVPAGVLVLFVLGALAVDVAIAFQAQRELSATAAALANDAATVALSDDRFYAENAAGAVEVDEGQAAELVREALVARAPGGVRDVRWSVRSADDQVCVTLTARVDYLFSRAVPGAPQGATVTGRAVATAAQGGSPLRPSGVDC
jgi:Flp pilus assembly protein TadG